MINNNTWNLDAKYNMFNLCKFLCDRHFGIGADGVILLQKSEKADFRFRIINADGNETDICGNGMRCFCKYIFDNNLIN